MGLIKKGFIVEKGLLAKRVYVYKKNVYVYTNYYNIYFIIILLLYYIFYFTLSFHVNDPIQKKILGVETNNE